MPRNMSFSLTTQQIRNRTKTVTRRVGWKSLKAGDTLNACVKCMGLKPGEKIQKLATIVVLSVKQERLDSLVFNPTYGKEEAEKEGFPLMTGGQFVEMFCEHMKGASWGTEVTRIEFGYVD